MERQSGFTLQELIITLALGAVLVTVVVPAFSHVASTNRSAAAVNELLTALQLARSTAVARAVPVTFCRGRSACGDAAWQEGWLIFSDADGDRVLEPTDGDRVVRTVENPAPGYTLDWRAFGSNVYIQFTPTGQPHGQNGTFRLCPEHGAIRYARGVIVSRTGRARVTRDNDGDTVHEDARGRPLTCS